MDQFFNVTISATGNFIVGFIGFSFCIFLLKMLISLFLGEHYHEPAKKPRIPLLKIEEVTQDGVSTYILTEMPNTFLGQKPTIDEISAMICQKFNDQFVAIHHSDVKYTLLKVKETNAAQSTTN